VLRIVPDMRIRRLEPEMMDQPNGDIEKLYRTLGQFELINRLLSGSRRLLREALFPHFASTPDRKFEILDVGAGACDIPMWIARVARSRGWRVHITALDADPRIVSWARRAVSEYPEIDVVEGNALELRRHGKFDFILANHFLHHLVDADILDVVTQIDAQARFGFLLNDLRRRAWAYLGFTLYAILFAHRSLTRVDGLLSIRKGFLREELEALTAQFPGSGMEVFTAFPARVGLRRGPVRRGVRLARAGVRIDSRPHQR
jgi:2-polyprenyl-3-methyl-5-hydroxy-6-metoxy-1,4-benzoquinol methylase